MKASPQIPSDQPVICPICLHEMPDWNTLDHWRWDPATNAYAEFPIPPQINQAQLNHLLRGASVRCPSQSVAGAEPHYLPADYGRFGRPVILGFVGLTKSGKSHLLASMVGAIVRGELEEQYSIFSSSLDPALHRQFMDSWVSPLLQNGRVLPGTAEDSVGFADAFLMKGTGGPDRVVAFFDVAGGDLVRENETTRFLWIADGLFFVIDPDHVDSMQVGDMAFRAALDVLRKRGSDAVSAAIILNKTDKIRFEPPVNRWLRPGRSSPESGTLDPVEFLRESADVYGYLDAHNAVALTVPYAVCGKATLHFASSTGTEMDEAGVYPRGVAPQRVLRPLAAMLAMTGVLTEPAAGEVGV